LIQGFLIWIYAPLGIIWSLYIWSRPVKDIMIGVSIFPLILLFGTWFILAIDYLFSLGLFSSTSLSIAFLIASSVFIFILGCVHVILAQLIYYFFREFDWVE